MERRQTLGYVYAAINHSMPGLVKVGLTRRPPRDRLDELSRPTGVPTPFSLVYAVLVEDAAGAERAVQSQLAGMGFHRTKNREFFEAPIHEVVRLLIRLREAQEPLAVGGGATNFSHELQSNTHRGEAPVLKALRGLCEWAVSVETASGEVVEPTVGELLGLVRGRRGVMSPKNAHAVIQKLGLRVDARNGIPVLLIANRSKSVRKLTEVTGSPEPQSILRALDGAGAGRTTRFGARVSRTTVIPLGILEELGLLEPVGLIGTSGEKSPESRN